MADDLIVESADHGYLPSCTASATRRTAPGDWWWQLLASHRDNDMDVNELPINLFPAPITVCDVTGRDFPVYLRGVIRFRFVFLWVSVSLCVFCFCFFSCVTSLAEVFSFTCVTSLEEDFSLLFSSVYFCDVTGRGLLVYLCGLIGGGFSFKCITSLAEVF